MSIITDLVNADKLDRATVKELAEALTSLAHQVDRANADDVVKTFLDYVYRLLSMNENERNAEYIRVELQR